MEKGTVIIGIDPDNQESGVGAVFDDKKFLAYKMNFPALIDYLKAMNESCKKVKVVIEGGWLNKSNWHVLNRFMTAVKAAAIGRSTGMNHQTGILIVECCEHYNIPYEINQAAEEVLERQGRKNNTRRNRLLHQLRRKAPENEPRPERRTSPRVGVCRIPGQGQAKEATDNPSEDHQSL